MTTNTIDKWCAVCGKLHAHTITRQSTDGNGHDFTVTRGMCDTCIDRSNSRFETMRETINRARRAL